MRFLRELWHDREGAFAPIASLIMVGLLGFAALAIDMGYNYYNRNKLQVAADSSALAGASQLQSLVEDGDSQPIIDEARAYAENNMPAAQYGTVLAAADIVPGNWDPDTRTFTATVSDPSDYNAVQTTTRREDTVGNPVPAFLGGIFGFDNYDIVTSAIATEAQNGNMTPSGCLMATSETEEEAFHIFGTADISTTDCNIEVASEAECAFYANGNPTITTITDPDGDAPQINIAGTYCEKGSVGIDTSGVNEDANVGEDPYEDVDPCDGWALCQQARDPNYCDNAEPAYINASFEGDGSPPSGVYCGGITFTGNGTANFDGDYIIKEGALDIGGNITVDGSSGVGFYLMGTGSVINFKGESDLTLVAQSSGSPLDGFIFYEEDKDPKESHTLRGTTGGGYDGLLYFDGDVEFKGTADSLLTTYVSDCTVLIANTIYFNGTTGLTADSTCEGAGPTLPPGAPILVYRLVN
ncbi:pilus assembly protein TadG-related protein [Pelagibius marinus]|uniref:pilus assembly protein TadG-related protein n=1 Tax=Pelagibius marinus TaxID=2762760 RepID=UPI001872CA37|nr:pilus assembly protein TadG-related protein [Pelagibius marinus]